MSNIEYISVQWLSIRSIKMRVIYNGSFCSRACGRVRIRFVLKLNRDTNSFPLCIKLYYFSCNDFDKCYYFKSTIQRKRKILRQSDLYSRNKVPRRQSSNQSALAFFVVWILSQIIFKFTLNFTKYSTNIYLFILEYFCNGIFTCLGTEAKPAERDVELSLLFLMTSPSSEVLV